MSCVTSPTLTFPVYSSTSPFARKRFPLRPGLCVQSSVSAASQCNMLDSHLAEQIAPRQSSGGAVGEARALPSLDEMKAGGAREQSRRALDDSRQLLCASGGYPRALRRGRV